MPAAIKKVLVILTQLLDRITTASELEVATAIKKVHVLLTQLLDRITTASELEVSAAIKTEMFYRVAGQLDK